MEDQEQVLTYENFIKQFLAEFPEFNQRATERRKHWEDYRDGSPLNFIFIADVLNDYLMKNGLMYMDNPQFLKRVFAFMEKMALAADPMVPDLLETGTLEIIGDDKVLLERARKMMGPKTLELSHHIEKSWGRE
jgi:hypothetical protein